ncbi:MAG TPA: hypothetical protein VGF63_13450 [Solirubrobacteraceae bacterium]|jgi:hypothetical protein
MTDEAQENPDETEAPDASADASDDAIDVGDGDDAIDLSAAVETAGPDDPGVPSVEELVNDPGPPETPGPEWEPPARDPDPVEAGTAAASTDADG